MVFVTPYMLKLATAPKDPWYSYHLSVIQ